MKNKFIVYGLLAGGTYLAYKHFTKKSKMDITQKYRKKDIMLHRIDL